MLYNVFMIITFNQLSYHNQICGESTELFYTYFLIKDKMLDGGVPLAIPHDEQSEIHQHLNVHIQ